MDYIYSDNGEVTIIRTGNPRTDISSNRDNSTKNDMHSENNLHGQELLDYIAKRLAERRKAIAEYAKKYLAK